MVNSFVHPSSHIEETLPNLLQSVSIIRHCVYRQLHRHFDQSQLHLTCKKGARSTTEDACYTLHRLRLAVRDRFVSVAVSLVRRLSKETLRLHRSTVRGILWETLFMSEMQQISTELIEKAPFLVLSTEPPDTIHNQWPCFLLLSIAFGRLQFLEKVLHIRKIKKLLSETWSGMNAIHFACLCSDGNSSLLISLLKLLIDRGVDAASPISLSSLLSILAFAKSLPNTFIQKEFAARHDVFSFEICAARGRFDAVVYLINRIQRWNVFVHSHFSLLLQQHVEMSIWLAKAGVPLTQKNALGQNPLHLAAQKGSLRLVIAYVYLGIRIDDCDSFGRTPLHYAATHKHRQCFGYLASKKASLSAKDQSGKSPAQLAPESWRSSSPVEEADSSTASIEANLISLIDDTCIIDQMTIKGFRCNDPGLIRSLASMQSASQTFPSELVSARDSVTKKFSFLNGFTALFRKR